jgi:uncharacterized protein
MDINLEAQELHAIKSYNDLSVTINNIIYNESIVVSQDQIIPNLAIKFITELSIDSIEPIIKNIPEVIIVGHKNLNQQIPANTSVHLANLRIGLECMSIGAACRTFNVLLSESRKVVLLIIF